MSLCLLQAVKGTLITKDFLLRRTLQVDPLYVLCKLELESVSHRFFNCPFSIFIWSVRRLKLGMNQKHSYIITEEITTLKNTFTKRSGIRKQARLFIPIVVWHIWRERNNRIFNSKEKTQSDVLKEILLAAMILCTEEAKGGRENPIMINWL